MNLNLPTLTSVFERAGVSLQRGSSALVGNSNCCQTAGVRIELGSDKIEVKAVKLLFPASSAEPCRSLIHAFWEIVSQGQLWRAKADECIKCALEEKQFAETIEDIEIKLHRHGTEAELVAQLATPTPQE